MRSAFRWQLRGSLTAFAILLASQAVLLGLGINAVLSAYNSAQLREIESLARQIVIDPESALARDIQHSGPLFVYSADKALVYSNRGRGRSVDPASYRPIVIDGVTVGYYYAEDTRFLASVPNRIFLVLLGVLMAGSMVLSFGIAAAFAVKSSRRIAGSVQKVQSDLHELVSLRPVPGRDLPVTELSEMSGLLRDVSVMLSDQEEYKRRWMSNLAHDLRTPVAGLRGQLEAMRDGVLATSEERLARTLVEVERLEEMIESMTELQGLEAAQDVQKDAVDLNALFTDLARSYELQMAEAGMSFVIGEVAGAPKASRVLLTRALGNILSNAIRYAEGGTQVTARSRTAGDAVEIDIQDDGPGVPEEDLPRLFQRFFRGDSSRSTAGAGLGLNITKEIILRHGGTIHASNVEPHGLLIAITIPNHLPPGAG